MQTMDMLHRASAIIEREIKKEGATALQLKRAGSLTKALRAMVDASLTTRSCGCGVS